MAKMTGNLKKTAAPKAPKAAPKAAKKDAVKVEAKKEEPVAVVAAPVVVETPAPAPVAEKKLSKRQTVIKVMKENKDKAADDVIKLAAEALGESIAYARHLYKYCVKHELADGEPLTGGRGRGPNPNSKRQRAIAVMTEREGDTMAAVLPEIMAKCELDENGAKGLYKYIVEHKLAPGVFVKAERKLKAQLLGKGEALKSPEEIEAIKSANLSRLAEVKAKLEAKKAKQAEAAATVEAVIADESLDKDVPAFAKKL